ncbi:proteasome maturation [Sarcoptes scabiei]|nr:proteasome maturation [Sarcoptes scabiei]
MPIFFNFRFSIWCESEGNEIRSRISRQNTLNGLLGPSGAGKTSLIRCLTGNVPDEHLSIDTEIYLDRNLYDRKDRISLVSFVPQSLNEIVYEQFNVIDILRYAFRFKNPFAKHHEADRFIEEIAKKLLLDSRIFYQKFSKCSGGEQRRIVIAQELMSMESNPPFLIVDEPTSGLDSEAALLLMQCLSLLTRNKSMTIIVSIHQPSSEIVELFDHLYVIGKGGVCLFTGPPKNLRSHLKIIIFLLAMALNAIVFTLTTYFVVQIPIDHYEINCFRIVNLFFFTLLIIIYFQSFGILCGTLFSSNAEIAVVVANFILNNLTIVNGLLITLEIMKKPFLVQISNYLGYRYLTDGLLYAFYGIDRCDPQTEHSIMLKRLFIDDSNIYWNIRPAIIIIIIVRLEIYLVTFMKTNPSIVSKLCYRKQNRLKKIQAEIEPIDYSVTRSGDQSVEKNTLDADNDTPSFKEDKSKKCFEPNNRLLIAWRNLNLFASDSIYETRDLPQKSHHQFDSKQLILSDQNGHLRFGTLYALMGTSGAGKTSLLKTLNGQMKIRLASSTEFHLSRFTPIRTCYITQDISKHLLPGLTVRQSLIYAARLKNINQTIGCDVEKIVSELMRELDLIDTAETLVQNCSGGQRKRIALALELTSLKLPNLICIDEPTSGLDSSSALFVAKYLKRLVRYHPYITIVASIHQPSTELLMIFDHCYLLAREGILIYSGRPDSMRSYLEECLEKNDLQCIPIEMLIKYSCYGGNNRKVQQMSRIINEREKNLEQEIQTDLVQILDGIPLNRNRFNLISITILFERYLNYFLHNRWIEWAIFYTIYISLGIIFRSFFNPSIAEPNGCLSFDDDLIGACFDLSDSKLLEESQIHNSTSYVVSASFFFCFIVSIQTMFTFNYEMEFFANEHRNGWYGCGAFYAVKILFEILPIFPIVFIFIYIIDIYSSIVSNNFFLWNSIILLLAVISCHAISHIVAILTDGRLIIMDQIATILSIS